jgi:hypothetical protein
VALLGAGYWLLGAGSEQDKPNNKQQATSNKQHKLIENI